MGGGSGAAVAAGIVPMAHGGFGGGFGGGSIRLAAQLEQARPWAGKRPPPVV